MKNFLTRDIDLSKRRNKVIVILAILLVVYHYPSDIPSF